MDHPLWRSAHVLIGNSPAEQAPSPSIKCPMYFDNGHLFANAFHTLDLSDLPTTGKVRGAVTVNNDTIEPVFSSSIAVATTQASDGYTYLLVAGEGTVTGGTGYFHGVTQAIVRCKYKVAAGNPPLLIACVDCILVLIRH
jgi:hypothetical protein